MCNIVDPHRVATITILEWVLKGNGMLVCYKQCVSRINVLPHSLVLQSARMPNPSIGSYRIRNNLSATTGRPQLSGIFLYSDSRPAWVRALSSNAWVFLPVGEGVFVHSEWYFN